MLRITFIFMMLLSPLKTFAAPWEYDFFESVNGSFEVNQNPRELSPALEAAIDFRSSGTIHGTRRALLFGKANASFTFYVVASTKAWATNDSSLEIETFSSGRIGGPYAIKVSGKLKDIVALLEANVDSIKCVKSDPVGWFDTMNPVVQKAVVLFLAGKDGENDQMTQSIVSRLERYASLKATRFDIKDLSKYEYAEWASDPAEESTFVVPQSITDRFRRIWVADELRKLHGKNFEPYFNREPTAIPAGRLKAFYRSVWFIMIVIAENADEWHANRRQWQGLIAEHRNFSDLRAFLDKKALEASFAGKPGANPSCLGTMQ